MMEYAESYPEYRRHALLYLLTYAFLLRLPSEALPAVAGGEGVEGQAVLACQEEKLTLPLKRRKNKPQGSCLTRGCW